MIFTLNAVQPSSHAQKGLAGGEEVLRFRCVHETDGPKEFDSVGLMTKVPEVPGISMNTGTARMESNALRFKFTDSSPTICHLHIVDAGSRLCEYTKLACECFHELGDAFFSLFRFLPGALGNRGLKISQQTLHTSAITFWFFSSF